MTPAQRKMLQFIADGGKRGRMQLAIIGSSRNPTQAWNDLRRNEWIEVNVEIPIDEPEFYRVTAKGHAALNAPPLVYRPDSGRYVVYLGDEQIGFVREDKIRRLWNAVDTFEKDRNFGSRDAAGEWLRDIYERRRRNPG